MVSTLAWDQYFYLYFLRQRRHEDKQRESANHKNRNINEVANVETFRLIWIGSSWTHDDIILNNGKVSHEIYLKYAVSILNFLLEE